jgi:hypothetical protein
MWRGFQDELLVVARVTRFRQGSNAPTGERGLFPVIRDRSAE